MTLAQQHFNQGVQKGLQAGIEQGIEKGMQKGRMQGIQEGIEKGQMTVAKNMLAKGMDLTLIAETTGIALSILQAMQKDTAQK